MSQKPVIGGKTMAENRKKNRPRPAKRPAKPRSMSPEEHYCMIQEAAYFLAEKDGFKGDPFEYWVKAESEVAARLKKN
jgi:hypothetical protein